jgi:RNA polymerase sigma-70 factor (ECF subfamily)
MSSCEDYAELVRKAQLGDRECLTRLAEAAKVRLHEYVFRLTLQETVTQDIVQETILEMLRVFKKLRRADRLWPWLYGIALNKVRDHYGRGWRRRAVSLGDKAGELRGKDDGDVVCEVVSRELKEIVVQSMRELEPRHRAILTMRCYDQMRYAQIAKLMGCSELCVRALFYRAKRALAGRLAGHGLGKGSLLLALAVFGKLTAGSEAAAANVSVTAATMKVGLTGTLAGMATCKSGAVVVGAAGVIVAGSVAVTSDSLDLGWGPREQAVESELDRGRWAELGEGVEECWHFFPEGAGGAVMTRLIEYDASARQPYCRYLQNRTTNYRFDNEKNVIYMTNARMRERDLSVKRLPTDGSALSEFISEVEGRPANMEFFPSTRKGLLVISKRSRSEASRIWRIDRHVNVLEEEYFQFNWPESTRIVDNRDAMHKRGWTYFRISGELRGERVSGVGRIPFSYAASETHHPWLRLRVGDSLEIVDSGTTARVYDGGGDVVSRYEGGAFFGGLARPWMGLHTIDTVRRDAAEQQIYFETRRGPSEAKVKIILGCGETRLVYTINLRRDIVEKIMFSGRASGGELRFSYHQSVAQTGDEFVPPRTRGSSPRQRDRLGMLWLVKLAEGGLNER